MKLRNRFLIRLAARLLSVTSRLWLKTVRTEIQTAAPHTNPYEDNGDNRYLYCMWHDAILGSIFTGRSVRMAALVSRHRDGTYVADALQTIGIEPIRGSSHRGGAAALRQLIDAAREFDISIATDGPRGPRRVVKEGIIYLASQTGRKIVPIAYAGTNAWRPRGKWTDLVVPKPFTTAYLFGGEPMSIPPGLSRTEISQYRQKLQDAMDDLTRHVEMLAAGETPPAETDMKRAA